MTFTVLMKRFGAYLKTYHLNIILGFLSGIIGGTTTVVTTFLLGKSVDLLLGKNQVQFSPLYRFIFYLFLLIVVTSVTQYFTQYFANKIAYQSVNLLRKEALEKLDQLPLRFFDSSSQGDLLSRFTNDMDNISIAVTAVFTQLFQGVTTIILSLIFMFYLSPALSLTVLISTPMIFLVNFIVANQSQKTFKAQQEILGALSGYAKEGITQQKIIKAFQMENTRQRTFEAYNQELYVKGQKAQFASSLTNPMARFVDHLAYVAIAFTAGYLYLYHPGKMTIGILSSFVIYAGQFSKPFIELSGLMTQLQTARIGLERSFYLLDQKELHHVKEEQLITSTTGKIEFKHVDFSYSPKQKLITNFNLNVNPGEIVAIVGKTGAGKSTLVNLLMRFYEVDKGEILLDGKNIQEISRDSLRQQFGMVLQETWLYHGTIAENIKFGASEATDEEMIAACKKAHIHHFIKNLPDGYQTVIGQGGLTISNGQRQLLTIARTMLKNPPLLILDEATSSVDTLTERQIQDGFNQMMQGKTSFIIAHRLSTIQNANLILVMDHGEVVQQGKHETLLQVNGPYKDLYEAQFTNEI